VCTEEALEKELEKREKGQRQREKREKGQREKGPIQTHGRDVRAPKQLNMCAQTPIFVLLVIV
jgi:hypothetical protein